MKRLMSLALLALVISMVLCMTGCKDYSKYEKTFVGTWRSDVATLWPDGDDSKTGESFGKQLIVTLNNNNSWSISFDEEELYAGKWQVTKANEGKNSRESYLVATLYQGDSKESRGTATYSASGARHESITGVSYALTVNLVLNDGSKLELKCNAEGDYPNTPTVDFSGTNPNQK